MAEGCGHDPKVVVEVLAADLDRIVEDIDTCIQIVADGVYEGQQTTRDRAVVNAQAWDIAFDDAGKSFLAKNNFRGSASDVISFLVDRYPFTYRRDPIPGWRSQAKKLRAKTNPHQALEHYHSFVKESGSFRSAIEQTAAAAEAEIDAAIDRMRGK